MLFAVGKERARWDLHQTFEAVATYLKQHGQDEVAARRAFLRDVQRWVRSHG